MEGDQAVGNGPRILSFSDPLSFPQRSWDECDLLLVRDHIPSEQDKAAQKG